ncbi:MAG TPA: hypothetical protein VK859_12605 [bacterium]|jgi:hypothetical protein|nr:hypothetical protein [bacterium]
MDEIKIKSGDKDLLTCGSIIAYQNQSLEFILPDANDENFILKCHFVENPLVNKNQPFLEASVTSPTTLELTYSNFSNVRTIGVAIPLDIGTLKNRKLYFIYRIDAIDSKDMKLFHYSFYLGEVVNAPQS